MCRYWLQQGVSTDLSIKERSDHNDRVKRAMENNTVFQYYGIFRMKGRRIIKPEKGLVPGMNKEGTEILTINFKTGEIIERTKFSPDICCLS